MDKRLIAGMLVLLLGAYWIFSGSDTPASVDEKKIASTALQELGCREGNDICALKQARQIVDVDIGGAAFFCRSIEDASLEDQCHYEIAIVLADQGAYHSANSYCDTLKNANPTYTKEGCKEKVLEKENAFALN